MFLGMSNLKDRILAHGMTVSEVAARAGTPTAHMYNLLNRVRRPRPELAKAIEAATHGVILWTEFFEDPPAVQDPPPSEDPDLAAAI